MNISKDLCHEHYFFHQTYDQSASFEEILNKRNQMDKHISEIESIICHRPDDIIDYLKDREPYFITFSMIISINYGITHNLFELDEIYRKKSREHKYSDQITTDHCVQIIKILLHNDNVEIFEQISNMIGTNNLKLFLYHIFLPIGGIKIGNNVGKYIIDNVALDPMIKLKMLGVFIRDKEKDLIEHFVSTDPSILPLDNITGFAKLSSDEVTLTNIIIDNDDNFFQYLLDFEYISSDNLIDACIKMHDIAKLKILLSKSIDFSNIGNILGNIFRNGLCTCWYIRSYISAKQMGIGCDCYTKMVKVLQFLLDNQMDIYNYGEKINNNQSGLFLMLSKYNYF